MSRLERSQYNPGSLHDDSCADCKAKIHYAEDIVITQHGYIYHHDLDAYSIGVCHFEKGTVCLECWDKEQATLKEQSQ